MPFFCSNYKHCSIEDINTNNAKHAFLQHNNNWICVYLSLLFTAGTWFPATRTWNSSSVSAQRMASSRPPDRWTGRHYPGTTSLSAPLRLVRHPPPSTSGFKLESSWKYQRRHASRSRNCCVPTRLLCGPRVATPQDVFKRRLPQSAFQKVKWVARDYYKTSTSPKSEINIFKLLFSACVILHHIIMSGFEVYLSQIFPSLLSGIIWCIKNVCLEL